MSHWSETPFAKLLVDSKDGEWGEGDEAIGLRETIIIRGTDFADLDNPVAEFPRRWIKDSIAERKRLQPGDIILETAGGTSTQSTGRSALLKESFFQHHPDIPVLCASFSRHLRLDTQRYSPLFIYYLLQTLHRAGYMAVFNIQHTGVSRFQYTTFKNHTELQIPDLPIQQQIAAILSAYDELIENNKRRIALLEKMAEEIYREWFVRLRFPGHEKVKFVKGVPEDWEFATVNRLVEFQSGYSFKSEKYVPNGQFGIVTIKNVHDGVFIPECSDFVEEIPSNMKKHCFLHEGDILMSLTGNVGRVCQVYGEHLLLNQRVAKLKPKQPKSSCYVYWFFRQPSVQTLTELISTGAAQQNLSPIKLGSQKVFIPSATLLEMFEEKVSPLNVLVVKSNVACQKLAQARDLLLGRLISGKLSVENLDIQFPPGMAGETEVVA